MSSVNPRIRIGIWGHDSALSQARRSWGIWEPGFAAALTASGAEPVALSPPRRHESWSDRLAGLAGVVFAGHDAGTPALCAAEASLLVSCRSRRLPLLAVDLGLLTLNTTFGGCNYLDLAREFPEALQHRHPPEEGLRHAITVTPGTHLARIYGEGEIVVNSEHRRAISRPARGFQISARALDGVIEAVESDDEAWFALGVQWQPASATASGLDIQLFRGLVDACNDRPLRAARAPRRVAGARRARQLVAV
jgi:putative glutamine amidotransferase